MDTPAVQAVKAKTKAPYSHATNDQARRGVPEHESFATVRRVTLQGLRMSSPIKLGEASLQLRHNKRLPWLQRLRRRQTTSLHWPRSTTFIYPPPFFYLSDSERQNGETISLFSESETCISPPYLSVRQCVREGLLLLFHRH